MCSRNKITCSTKTHTRECKSRACNLITASGKQVSNGLRQENHRTYLSKLQAGIQVIFKLWRYPNPTFPIFLQGIQTPAFPILFQGIQTLPLQYSFKVSKHNLSNIVSMYPNPSFPILFQDIQTPLSNILARYPNPTFPIFLQGIQTPPFQYCCKVSKPLSFQYCFKVSKPCLYNIVSRYPNTTFPILFQCIQTPPFQYCFKISKPPFPI